MTEVEPDSLFSRLADSKLLWIPELGIGWFPVKAQPYDLAYWENYRRLDQTPSGDALTAMRRDLVAKHWQFEVTDIGIGGGRFVTERESTWGYDVNPCAVEWLRACNRFHDPYKDAVDAATFWDSLEHIFDPGPLLANIRRWVFVSLPIFTSCDDVLRSKHFKKEEHCWYFTVRGLDHFMRLFGFECIDFNRMERDAGREQIDTFVFRRERESLALAAD